MPDLINAIIKDAYEKNGKTVLIIEKDEKKYSLELPVSPKDAIIELGTKNDVYSFLSGATVGRIDRMHHFIRDPSKFSDGNKAWEYGYYIGYKYGLAKAREIASENIEKIEKHPLLRRLIHPQPSITDREPEM